MYFPWTKLYGYFNDCTNNSFSVFQYSDRYIRAICSVSLKIFVLLVVNYLSKICIWTLWLPKELWREDRKRWWEALNVIAANLSTDDEETMECHLKSQQESPKAQCVQTFLWKKQKQQKQITVTTEYSHSFNTYVLVLFILSLKTCN